MYEYNNTSVDHRITTLTFGNVNMFVERPNRLSYFFSFGCYFAVIAYVIEMDGLSVRGWLGSR